MKEEITLSELAKTYGYSVPAVMKWKERGMPYNTNTRRAPKEKAIAWVLENIINPLREVDIQSQIAQEKLRKARGEADAIELKNRVELNDLIPLAYVESALAGFCGEVKQSIMQIPTIHALEIMESAVDQKTLKDKLKEILSERLNEIGDIMLNPSVDQYDEYSEDNENADIQEEENADFEVL
ncbi:hypothetical protein NI508_000005 [Salmonella enterica]|nr:hypothetical protein [Salmonella enterica]EJJ4477242.1 hypothetical protein [Salmonella enterica]EJJ4620750.1 hypothetical protein [Salmonella enterica]